MSRLRPMLTVRRVAAVLLGLLALAVVWLILSTHLDTQPLAFISGPSAVRVPAWTQPCWRQKSPTSHRYTLPCARVRGRVVYRQTHDPDGDGDRHVVVVAGLRLVTLKIRASSPVDGLPGLGARVTAVGRYQRGAGELGSSSVAVASLQSP